VITLPLSLGASSASEIELPSAVATGWAGGWGAEASATIASEAAEAALSPMSFVATTVHV